MIKSFVLPLCLALLLSRHLKGETCNDTELRAVRLDRQGNAGQMEVCWRTMDMATEWKPVCNNTYYEQNAGLLCGHLGFMDEGHEIIEFNNILEECLDLTCLLSPNATYSHQCSSSFAMDEAAVGVICATSGLRSTTENIQVSQRPSNACGDSQTKHEVLGSCTNSLAAVGGVLGVVIVVLVIAIVEMSSGWMYRIKYSKPSKIKVPSASSNINTCDYEEMSPGTITMTEQKTTAQNMSETNSDGDEEEDVAGDLYQEMERPVMMSQQECTYEEVQQKLPHHELKETH